MPIILIIKKEAVYSRERSLGESAFLDEAKGLGKSFNEIDFNAHRASWLGKLEGIRLQIEKDLLQSFFVRRHLVVPKLILSYKV